jgi:hypothetical protein
MSKTSIFLVTNLLIIRSLLQVQRVIALADELKTTIKK